MSGEGQKRPRSAEMLPGPGFRVRGHVERMPRSIIEGFADFETPDVSDLMNRLYTMSAAVRGLTPSSPRILGPACTVKVFPGDNLMVHKALDLALPGDVVVVDAGGSAMNAVLGDIICTKARHRKIAGFVVDGYIRDIAGIVPLAMPVFARGITPIGPLHRGPGEVNFSIQCGGIVVQPGDLIVGDENGVVVVPQSIAPVLLERLRARKQSMTAYLEAVKEGSFSNDWVDELLKASDCEVRPG